jgi:hypothetical protein
MRIISGATLGVAWWLAAVASCGNGAVGTNACRQIEEARCRKAPSCPNISLEPPYHTADGDVQACIRAVDIACLHGLPVADPGGASVSLCVAAIQNDGCGTVDAPQTDPACAWLVAPAASSSSSSADAAPEASSDASAEAADSDSAAGD